MGGGPAQGNNMGGGGGLFGANLPNPAQQQNTPMFGGGPTNPFGNQNKQQQPAPSGGMFSNAPQTQAGGAQTQPQQPNPQTNQFFGNNPGAGGAGLFGNQPKPQQEENKAPTMSFGMPNASNPNPIFSQPQPQPTQNQGAGLFGGIQNQNQGAGLFGAPPGNTGIKPQAPPSTGGGLFNSPSQNQQPQTNPNINNPPAQPANPIVQPQPQAQNKNLAPLDQNTNPAQPQFNPQGQPQTQPQMNNAMGPNIKIGAPAGGGFFANNNQPTSGLFAPKTDQSKPSQDQNKQSQANLIQPPPQTNVINAGGQKPNDLKDMPTDAKTPPIHNVSTPHLNAPPNLVNPGANIVIPGPNMEKERKAEEKPPGIQIGAQEKEKMPQMQQNEGEGQQMIGNEQKKESNQKYPTFDTLKSKEKELQGKGAPEYGQKGFYLII